MEFIAIKINSKDWDFMWNWLAEHEINKNLSEPRTAENNGHAWEYMGSFKHKGKVLSEFQHKLHPLLNKPYKAIVEHIDFDDNNIEKSAKIK
jgi:hypothetical protein